MAPPFACFDALAIQNGGRRTSLAPALLPQQSTQIKVEHFKGAVIAPPAELVVDSLPGRQVVRQVSPGTAVSKLIEQGIHNLAQLMLAGSACTPSGGFRQVLLQPLPLGGGKVGGVYFAFHNFSLLEKPRLFQHTLSTKL